MSVISWIKDKCYEFQYQRAIENIKVKNYDEAGSSLDKLFNKHPRAIAGLARLYHKLGAEAEGDQALTYYNKALKLKDCIEKNFRYDVTLYKKEINSIIQEIETRADRFFNSNLYDLCLSYLNCIKSYDRIERYADQLYSLNLYELAIKFLNTIESRKNADSLFIDKLNKYHLLFLINNAYQEPTKNKAIASLSLQIKKSSVTIQKYYSDVLVFCQLKTKDTYYSRSIAILDFLYPDTKLPIEMLSHCYVRCILGKDFDKNTSLDIEHLVPDSDIKRFYQFVVDKAQQMISTNPKEALKVCRKIIGNYFDCAETYFKVCKELHDHKQSIPEVELLCIIKQLPSTQRQLDTCRYFLSISSFEDTYYNILSDFIIDTYRAEGSAAALALLGLNWLNENPKNIFETLLSDAKFKYDLLDYVIENSAKFLENSAVTSTILNTLENDNNADYTIAKLELIIHKKLAADLYVKKIIYVAESSTLDEKLAFYDRGLKNLAFYDKGRNHVNFQELLQKKLALTWDYVACDNLEKALQILQEVAIDMSVAPHLNEQLCDKYYTYIISKVLTLCNTESVEKAIEFLENKWKEKYPRNIFPELLSSESLSEPLLKHLVEKSKKYIFSKEVLNSICDVISKLSSEDFALSLYERLNENGFDIKKYYLCKINAIISTLPIEKKELLLNRAISVFKDSKLISQKSALVLGYFEQRKTDDAFRLANEMQSLDKTVIYDLCYLNIQLSKLSSTIDEGTKYLSEAERIWIGLSEARSGRYTKKQLVDLINETTLYWAKKCETSGDITSAVSLVSNIASHYTKAANEIARIFKKHLVKEDTDSVAVETRCYLIKEAITQICKISEDVSDDPNFIALWECLIHSTLLKFKNRDINVEYDSELTELWENLQECKLSSKANNVSESLQKELSKVKKELAIYYEKLTNYQVAIQKYNELKKLACDLSSWATNRSLICIIKSSDQEIISNYIIEITKRFKEKPSSDLYELIYRYCIYIIRCGNYDDALGIIKKFLPNEAELLSVCKNHFISLEEEKLREFNLKIESIQHNEMSSDAAKAFLKSFDTFIKGFIHIYSFSIEEQSKYKNCLKNYIIHRLYVENKYEECYSALKTLHGDYIDNMMSMRNLAIMSLEIAENGLLSDSNYKDIISIWLTAIYDERIFVESLQHTQWDDKFTFTLKNALGNYSEHNYGLLPSNVNFNLPTPNVVEIRGVQNALISRFETSLVNTPEYFAYYQTSKKAIDSLIALNLDERCRAYAPGVIIDNSQASFEIHNALNQEERQHYDNWEKVLKTACMYGFTSGIYGTYNTANDYLNSCKDALERNNIRSIRSAFTSSKIDEIKKFNELQDTLNVAVYASFSKARGSMTVDRILSIFSPITEVLDDSQLNYTITNFVNQEVIQQVNNKDISLAKASKMMLEAYKICPSNRTVQQNLHAMTESLVMDYITSGENDAVNSLVEILSATNEFNSAVISALKGNENVPEELKTMLFAANEQNFTTLKNTIYRYSPAIRITLNSIASEIAEMNLNVQLNQIAERLKADTLSKKDALNQLYNLYLQHQSNENICEVLAIVAMQCIMEYIANDKPGKVSVITTLNNLRNNRSATFNAHNSHISNTRREILNSMSYENKQALLYHSDRLTAQGRALKLALDYLQYLS